MQSSHHTPWANHYAEVATTLHNLTKVKAVATAFNTNVDAVLKISGQQLAGLVKKRGLSWEELTTVKHTKLLTPDDVLRGAFKCFSKGIAEEWLTEDTAVYEYLAQELGYNRLQMGGQGGIVANALAVCGVDQVFCHCNSLPKLQADQFLKLDNLLSFDENGQPKPAWQINRQNDTPLIHWIIEFDRDDVFELDGHQIVCPKSNRFIATYDPLNLHLVMDANFVEHMSCQPLDCVILSGYHALTANNDGVALVKGSVAAVKSWQNNGALIHLEVASTQDMAVRKAVVEEVAAISDSIGLNERETIDVLEVIDEPSLAQICEEAPTAVNLFDAMVKIKKTVGCGRIQMHMFGLYITLQDKNFVLTPQQNRQGMCLAATVAASKAGTGHINAAENLLWSKEMPACQLGLDELKNLAEHTANPAMVDSGIGQYEGFDIIAVPTILVEKPLTLVGMGDTISSVSLVGALGK